VDLVPMLAPVRDLGGFIRDQRQLAQLSMRGLAARAGISNPYLSQVERGLRRPSAEILAQIAHGLSISVESLLAKAGVLPDSPDHLVGRRADQRQIPEVITAIGADTTLTGRQKSALIEIYQAFMVERDASPPGTALRSRVPGADPPARKSQLSNQEPSATE